MQGFAAADMIEEEKKKWKGQHYFRIVQSFVEQNQSMQSVVKEPNVSLVAQSPARPLAAG